MITVKLIYSEENEELSHLVEDLTSLQAEIPHHLVKMMKMPIEKAPEKQGYRMPYLEIGPFHLESPFTRQDLAILLKAAQDRVDQLTRVDPEGYQKQVMKSRNISAADRLSTFLANRYLWLVIFFLGIYSGLPFLAPVLMKLDHPLPATVIYKIYSPMCHQLAFRSWFLFGEQTYYPRSVTGIQNVITYEELQNSNTIDLIAARNFVGNPVVGYKVALCERDVAIYFSMFLFAVVFLITGKKWKSLPWYLWVAVGMIPIGLDGFSQLPGLMNNLPAWLPIRESTPLLRTLTGALFGWMTGWYLFPMLEDTARETRQIMQHKVAVIEQTRDLKDELK